MSIRSQETLMLILLNCLALFGLLFVLILLVRLSLWCLRCNIRYINKKKTQKSLKENPVTVPIDQQQNADDEEAIIGGGSANEGGDSGATTTTTNNNNDSLESIIRKPSNVDDSTSVSVVVDPPEEFQYVEINVDSLVPRNITNETFVKATNQESNAVESLSNNFPNNNSKDQIPGSITSAGTNNFNPYATLTFPRIKPKSRPANGQCNCQFCQNKNTTMNRDKLAPIQCLYQFEDKDTDSVKTKEAITPIETVVTIEHCSSDTELDNLVLDQHLETQKALEKLDKAIEEMEQFNRYSTATDSDIANLVAELSEIAHIEPELPPKSTLTEEWKPEIPIHSYPKSKKVPKKQAPKVPERDYANEEQSKPEVPPRDYPKKLSNVDPEVDKLNKKAQESNEIKSKILKKFAPKVPEIDYSIEESVPDTDVSKLAPELPKRDYPMQKLEESNFVSSLTKLTQQISKLTSGSSESPPEVPKPDYPEAESKSEDFNPTSDTSESPPEVPEPDYPKLEYESNSEPITDTPESPPEVPEPDYPKPKSEPDSEPITDAPESPPEVPEPDYPKPKSEPDSEPITDTPESPPEVPEPDYPKPESKPDSASTSESPPKIPEPDYPNSDSKIVDSESSLEANNPLEVPKPDYPESESKTGDSESTSNTPESPPEVPEPDYPKPESKPDSESTSNTSESSPEIPEPDYPKPEFIPEDPIPELDTSESAPESKLENSIFNEESKVLIHKVPKPDYPQQESKSKNIVSDSSESPPKIPKPNYSTVTEYDKSKPDVPDLAYSTKPKTDSNNNSLDTSLPPTIMKLAKVKKPLNSNGRLPQPEPTESEDNPHIINITYKLPKSRNHPFQPIRMRQSDRIKSILEQLKLNIPELQKRHSDSLLKLEEFEASERERELNQEEEETGFEDETTDFQLDSDSQPITANGETKETTTTTTTELTENNSPKAIPDGSKPKLVTPKKVTIVESSNPQLAIYSQVVNQIKQRNTTAN